MTNIGRARAVIAEVRALGATDFCVCSGSRNAPLLAVLGATSEVRLYSFVDERSAAFFAVGRARLIGSPVAVVTTSGTAVAELLPAAIEAHYTATPLILITADRPERYRGSGAPQVIEQRGIFGGYAATSIEAWNGRSPLHLNVEFDEPLIDETVSSGGQTILSVLRAPGARIDPVEIPFRRPLVVIGGLSPEHRERVRDFAVRVGAAVYAEPLSGLREEPALSRLLLTAGERILAKGDFDGVVRIGNVPTVRFWRDLDESRRALPVTSFSDLPFTGLTRGDVHPLEALPEGMSAERDEQLIALDRRLRIEIDRILDDEPASELSMLRALSAALPRGARVYLGNSLPIREWDLVATREPRGHVIEANRGANGIDGQLSTFFGWCATDAENVAIVGDLTTLYDLNAPWIVPQLDARFRIVIVNNGGGRIFERVASLAAVDPDIRSRVVDNAHALRFDAWAAMWGIEESVTELRPDLEASRRAWQRYDALWS